MSIGNRILKGILDEFTDSFGIKKLDEAKQFERLVNYALLSKIDPDAFSDPNVFEQVDVDGGSTFGLDAFALFINDALVANEDDIEIHRKARRMDVRFVFIQTKRSSSVDSGDLLKFVAAVRNLFAENPSIPLTDELIEARRLISEVFRVENARLFGSKRPRCELYYATGGGKPTDELLPGLLKAQEEALTDAVQEVGAATIKLVDADYIIDAYSEIENRFRVSITLEKSVPCDNIEDVVQAFIGFLPAQQFLKLIESSDGSLRKHVFYENVRDFQGDDNTVNNEIAHTLADPVMLDKFVLLNNGVTVVAREFSNIRATEYEIGDYFVVNGCQTSHMVYRHRDAVRENGALKIPVKIIHTNSNDLIAKIIRSTNRQTPVPDEAFVSLDKFHKRLQEFYRIFPSDPQDRLFYERRSKEYSSVSDAAIERPRIVNLHSQIRSFASVMMGEPQLVMSNNPSTILREHRTRLFVDDHKFTPYYLSALLLFKYHVLQSRGRIDGRFNYARYWLCWLARMTMDMRVDVGPMNSGKTDERCEQMVARLSDEEFCVRLFAAAIETFEHARTGFTSNNIVRKGELIRLRQFRDELRTHMQREISAADRARTPAS